MLLGNSFGRLPYVWLNASAAVTLPMDNHCSHPPVATPLVDVASTSSPLIMQYSKCSRALLDHMVIIASTAGATRCCSPNYVIHARPIRQCCCTSGSNKASPEFKKQNRRQPRYPLPPLTRTARARLPGPKIEFAVHPHVDTSVDKPLLTL